MSHKHTWLGTHYTKTFAGQHSWNTIHLCNTCSFWPIHILEELILNFEIIWIQIWLLLSWLNWKTNWKSYAVTKRGRIKALSNNSIDGKGYPMAEHFKQQSMLVGRGGCQSHWPSLELWLPSVQWMREYLDQDPWNSMNKPQGWSSVKPASQHSKTSLALPAPKMYNYMVTSASPCQSFNH